MQIGVSREEFEVHLQSAKHQRNKNVRDLSSLSSSAETVFSAPTTSIETYKIYDDGQKCDENHNRLSDTVNDKVDNATLSTNGEITSNSTTNSPKREDTTNNMANGNSLAVPNGTDCILEESYAFIETNIPFADPVVSGNSRSYV